jgi:predicted permease
MAVDPKTAGYSNERLGEFLRQLETRVTALPGVESAAAVNILPLSLAENGSEYRDAAGGDKAVKTVATEFAVTAGFFRTMGIPLLRGRSFQATDVKTSMAVINQTMARRLYGDADPIGRVIRSGDKRFEVIGVVGDSKAVTLGEEVKACAYFYLPRDAGQVLGLLGMTILVKTTGDPAAMTRPVRDEILKLDSNLAVFNVDTMTRHVSKAFLIPRVCATLFGVFGVVGLALAAVGLFGVVSYSVRSRTREIGIRMAIGAQPAEILRLVVGQGLGIVAVSLVLGLGAAWGLSRFTATMLYGISATDAITFIATPLVLLGSAVVAIVVPARRACSIRPMDALRLE